MRYETVQQLKDDDFKRSTGVECAIFAKMLAVVETGWRAFGRPSTLSRADQLLLTLMDWREDRPQFQIGLAYGVSEASVRRIIQKLEDVLIQSKQFHWPGKKALPAGETLIAVVRVDATEQPSERPQKGTGGIPAAKRSGLPKKHRGLLT